MTNKKFNFYKLSRMYDKENLPNDTEKILEIVDFIKGHKTRFKLLEDYYIGQHFILNDPKRGKNKSKPDNRAVVNYSRLVTVNKVGYFAGKPVDLKVVNDKLYEEQLSNIRTNNNDFKKFSELVEDASIYGVAYELLHTDINNKGETIVKYTTIPDPENVTMVLTNSLETEYAFAARLLFDTDESVYLELYSDDSIYTYLVDGDKIELIDEEEHFFNGVPINPFYNNDRFIGDFEGGISIQDNLNSLISNFSNEMQYSAEALVKITNAGATTASDIQGMWDDGGVILSEGQNVEFFAKQINTESIRSFKEILLESFFKTLGVPNWGDSSISGTTATEIKSKIHTFEQIVSQTESCFEEGFRRRYELVTNFLNIKHGSFDIDNLKDIVFTRNLPYSPLEISQSLLMLKDILSLETLLSQLPFIDSAVEEIARINKEKNEELSSDDIQSVINSMKKTETGENESEEENEGDLDEQ